MRGLVCIGVRDGARRRRGEGFTGSFFRGFSNAFNEVDKAVAVGDGCDGGDELFVMGETLCLTPLAGLLHYQNIPMKKR